MKKINMRRVLLCGLIAGLVLNIGESILNGVILAKDLEKLMGAPPSAKFLAIAVGMTFIAGIVMILLYAAIRPSFGAGVKTAIIAGLIAWFFFYFYTGTINAAAGFFPSNLVWTGIVWGLVEYSIGAIAGAKLYKEAEG